MKKQIGKPCPHCGALYYPSVTREPPEDMTVEVDGGRFDGRRFVLHIVVHGDRLGFVVKQQSYRHADPPVRAAEVESSR